MADLDDIKDGKDFGINTPQDKQGFFLKGGANYDWGIKNKMSRIFNPESGRTVMLAFDHGYFQGPTKGLERIDLNILPLAEHADVLMLGYPANCDKTDCDARIWRQLDLVRTV
jgi:putative autoinducer-2 (AI-2) aldolase